MVAHYYLPKETGRMKIITERRRTIDNNNIARCNISDCIPYDNIFTRTLSISILLSLNNVLSHTVKTTENPINMP